MPADSRGNLTLNLLTWRIWWAPNNASTWQMGFNSVFLRVNIYFFSTAAMFAWTGIALTLYVHWLSTWLWKSHKLYIQKYKLFIFSSSVDGALLYNLVKKTTWCINLFLVYFSISTCFVRLYALHREKQMYFFDTWYLLFCVDGWLLWRSICSSVPE